MYGKRDGRTLQNFCHADTPTKTNGLKSGCGLFPTKPTNVKIEVSYGIGLAEQLRSYKAREAVLDTSKIGMFEWGAYCSAEEASDTVESESIKETSGTNSGTVGDNSPLGKMGEIGKDSAMNW